MDPLVETILDHLQRSAALRQILLTAATHSRRRLLEAGVPLQDQDRARHQMLVRLVINATGNIQLTGVRISGTIARGTRTHGSTTGAKETRTLWAAAAVPISSGQRGL